MTLRSRTEVAVTFIGVPTEVRWQDCCLDLDRLDLPQDATVATF